MNNFNATRFELNNIAIFSHDQSKQFSLFNQLLGFVLQEDIYSNTITGYVTIVDTVDLYNEFPFVGEEFINISYSIPDIPILNVEMTLAVNSITSPVFDPMHQTKTITFSIVSPEAVISASRLVSRATHNLNASDLVQEILTTDIATTKTLEKSAESGKVDAVFPNWHPFEAIKFLRKRSVSTNDKDKSPWLFYERLDGTYVFDTLKNIIQIGRDNYDEKKHLLRKQVIFADNYHTINPYLNIRRFSLASNMNKIGQLAEGELSSVTTQVDLLSKTFDDFNFKYDEQFSDLANKDMSRFKEYSKSFLKQHQETGTRFLLHSDFSYNELSSQNDVLGVQMGLKLAFVNSLDKGSVTIELPGNSTWKCGDVICLDLPKATGLEKQDYTRDVRLSGFYCIEAVNHEFTKGQMLTNIKVFSIGSNMDIDTIIETFNKKVKVSNE